MREKYFVLSYTVIDDYIERRREYRAAHLELARAAARGEVRLEAFARADPTTSMNLRRQRTPRRPPDPPPGVDSGAAV